MSGLLIALAVFVAFVVAVFLPRKWVRLDGASKESPQVGVSCDLSVLIENELKKEAQRLGYIASRTQCGWCGFIVNMGECMPARRAWDHFVVIIEKIAVSHKLKVRVSQPFFAAGGAHATVVEFNKEAASSAQEGNKKTA